MDLRTYLTAIRKSWLLIVMTTILGAAAGALAFLLTPPTYATTIDFYVSTPADDGSNPQSAGQFAEARVNSYIVLLSSEQMGRRVVDNTGLDLIPQQVARQIEASTELNTVIVTATITDGSPQRSLQIAQGVAETFPKLVDELDNQGRDTDIVVIHVVSGPTLGADPISPDARIYIGLGLAAGLVIGLIIAILREVLDNSVRTVESAQRLVGAPVIGTIPYDADTKRSPLIVGDEATSLRSEAYRQLRTNLQFINAARSANTIMVTSAVPLEGKSTTAVNLALTFVEFGERVLLIDADLRRPQLSQLLGLSNERGLTNVLAGQIELADVLQPWGAGGLSLLASGSTPPNPSELLGSSQMAELISHVQGRFDKVVIDTPPVLPVTDAAVASAYAEAVVVVVHHGRTTRTQVANAAATLENVDARVIGSVLNMKRSSRTERRRYGHHGYYFGQGGYGPPRGGNRAPAQAGLWPGSTVNGQATDKPPVDGSEDTVIASPTAGNTERTAGTREK
jgi:capsular exopolysaccharide synthesis family protein